jgi:hypothetical protein
VEEGRLNGKTQRVTAVELIYGFILRLLRISFDSMCQRAVAFSGYFLVWWTSQSRHGESSLPHKILRQSKARHKVHANSLKSLCNISTLLVK